IVGFMEHHDDELWEELIRQCLQKLEMVRNLLEHTVGNLDPLYIDVIDGDLCEQYPSLPADMQRKIADELDRTPTPAALLVVLCANCGLVRAFSLVAFSVFAGVGERTREGNDLYKEIIESVVIKLGDKQ
ncbi:hypothetical protein ACJX0J_033764, partial [Zea mays]